MTYEIQAVLKLLRQLFPNDRIRVANTLAKSNRND